VPRAGARANACPGLARDTVLRLKEDIVAEVKRGRKQIDGCVRLTVNDHKGLAEIGTKLGRNAPEEIVTVVTLDTMLAWNHKCADYQVAPSEPRTSAGRPRIAKEIED
jgi:hypothetical protein